MAIGLLVPNSIATVWIVRDMGITIIQKRFQIALVWALPLLGPVLTFLFRRVTSYETKDPVSDIGGADNQSVDFSVSHQMDRLDGGHDHSP